MLSKLQKISSDLILYSVLVSSYEKLDFKNDALAGVRANYFNSKRSPQVEKTDVSIDSRTQSLSYSMKSGEPLSWKITYGARPVQTVKRAADGGYCVMSYGDNGIIFKRQYFDGGHIWLRTEYYDRALENQIAAVIYPSRSGGLVTLKIQRFSPSGITKQELYPSLTAPRKRCAALIYSNSGMIWYDASFKPEAGEQPQESDAESGGFRFSKGSFIVMTSEDALHLAEAPYLSEADIPSRGEEPQPVEPEPAPYSAYDKIERILFEAHKTNKNIFGELAFHAAAEPHEPAEEADVTEAPATEEAATAEVSEPEIETVETPDVAEMPEITENPSEPEENTEPEPSGPEAVPEPVAEEAPETPEAPSQDEPAAEEAHDEEAAQGAESVTVANDDEPDATAVITTKKGVYLYYGETDGNGKREGKGRTVTADGVTAYEGDYLGDKRHGFGVCYYKDGSPNYIGDWADGSRSGRGVGYRVSDGVLHVGKWSGNKPEGFGARFDGEGNFLDVCTYVDGVRSGKSVSFDEDGNTVVRMWNNGELVSEKIISD